MVVDALMTTLADLNGANFPSSHNVSRNLVALWMGRHSGSKNSTFRSDLAAAVKAGWIVYPDSTTVRMTEAGLASLRGTQVPDPPSSNDDVHDHLGQVLRSDKTRRLINMLSDGQPHTREEVARQLEFRSGHTSSTFRSFCAQETGRGLMYYPSKTTMALTDCAFPFGRPEVTAAAAAVAAEVPRAKEEVGRRANGGGGGDGAHQEDDDSDDDDSSYVPNEAADV